MWRPAFLALGIFTVIVGLECLVLDKVVLNRKEEVAVASYSFPGTDAVLRNKEFVPPEWAPWSLLSAGAVTMLYTATIPKKEG